MKHLIAPFFETAKVDNFCWKEGGQTNEGKLITPNIRTKIALRIR